MLHTPRYDVATRPYCGPTAIAAITGAPISEVREVIRETWDRRLKSNGHVRPVIGITDDEMVEAMDQLGWWVAEKMPEVPAGWRRDNGGWNIKRLTLGAFLQEHGHRGPFIVNVTGHFIAVSHGEACDTFTKLPIAIARWRRGRKRWVRNWWRFETRAPLTP